MNIRTFSVFPGIDLSCIRLRQLNLDDTEDFYNYISNKNIKRYLSDTEIPKDLESARTELMYWANLHNTLSGIYWGIARVEDNKLIGTCGFNSWNKQHKRAEIGYDLSYDFWGNGFMTEAVKSITDFAFNNMGVKRVQAIVVEDNISSIRVLEKSGYKQEGLLKNFSILGSKIKDSYMYACV